MSKPMIAHHGIDHQGVSRCSGVVAVLNSRVTSMCAFSSIKIPSSGRVARPERSERACLPALVSAPFATLRGVPPAEVKALKDEQVRSVAPLQALAAEARQLEGSVAELVNAAYGLTPEEVALMWRTAPP